MSIVKAIGRRIIGAFGYEVRNLKRPAPAPFPSNVPDAHLYQPLFSPWLGETDFQRRYERAKPRTLVSVDRCWLLDGLATQAIHLEGDFWECGVYQGGTAAMFCALLNERRSAKKLYLFDTFAGMPETRRDKDWHQKGDFADTSLAAVQSFLGHDPACQFRPGLIPQTFVGLESHRIAFAHIDVDLYESVLESVKFIWPRLPVGGFIVFDDYGFPSCAGARAAVDEFFRAGPAVPLCLPTGQALVFKSLP